MVGGAGVPHDVQRRSSSSLIQISGYCSSRLELAYLIALRAPPINNLPSHSSAPSDTRQTPASKFCCSFHLFEAWQPVDPKTHRPHSGIFTPSRVTRPRIWPAGVKGLAILGLTRPQPQLHALQMQQRTMPYPSYISGVGCIHAGLPQGFMPHPLSRNPFLTSACSLLPLCASSFLCLSSLFDP